MHNDLPVIPKINYDFGMYCYLQGIERFLIFFYLDSDPNIFDSESEEIVEDPNPIQIHKFDSVYSGNEHSGYKESVVHDGNVSTVGSAYEPAKLAHNSPHKRQIHDLKAQVINE